MKTLLLILLGLGGVMLGTLGLIGASEAPHLANMTQTTIGTAIALLSFLGAELS